MNQTGGIPLLDEIRAFCRQHRIQPSQFGALAVRSPSLVIGLEQGRNLRPETVRRIRVVLDGGDPGAVGSVRRIMAANIAANYVSRGTRIARGYAKAKARNMAAEQASALHRATDPVEQAKLVIRRAGWACFEAAITRPEYHGQFFIGSRLVTREGLLEFAERHGWRRENG